jgi:hypothetical protein
MMIWKWGFISMVQVRRNTVEYSSGILLHIGEFFFIFKEMLDTHSPIINVYLGTSWLRYGSRCSSFFLSVVMSRARCTYLLPNAICLGAILRFI